MTGTGSSIGSKRTEHLHACAQCDLLVEIPAIIPHRTNVYCPRCHYNIALGHNNAKQHVLALAITALLLMVIACSFDFISFSANGQLRTISLFQTSAELFVQGYFVISILVAAFMFVLPAAYLILLCLIILNSHTGSSDQSSNLSGGLLSSVTMGKWMSYILPWTMSEVFLIGVLVALIKVISMADITLQTSFWAYVIFAPLFTYITSVVDAHRLWGWIDNAA